MARRRASGVGFGILLALAVLAWWLARPTARPPALNRPATEPEPLLAWAPPRPRPSPVARPRAPLEPAVPRCVPAASERCITGDVWLVDSCGNPEEKVEECAELGCSTDACEPPSTEPCEEPPEGRCDGDVVRLCLAGRSRAIDCRAQGLRCGYGEEGAECRPEVPWRERCTGPTHCEADVLVRCEDGRARRMDCHALRAKCLTLPGSHAPSCVEVKPLDPNAQDCGPCGCPPGERQETCDGRDEDGDGLVDQGVDCGPVPVLAFIVTGSSGQTSHAREDVEAELVAVNRSFLGSADKPGLSFVLEDVIELSAPSLLELDREELERLSNDPRIHPARETFYVPIVFTDSIVAGGGTPKPGISTLPNGMCGGMQQGRGPEVGVLAVAKARYATTVAHELGHFLGLCHTHDLQEAAPFVAVANAQTGALETCQKTCRGEGDGVCDTPYDPGPELCLYGADCRTACVVDAAPDPRNLMSYYAACRDLFSDEQRLLMQHTLALRRGWQRCLGFSCDCKLGGDSCPVGMSCRSGSTGSGEAVTRCALDGPRAPGADCQSTSDCGQGGVCLIESRTRAQRCVRPCLSSAPNCDCSKVADDLSVCIQDIGRAR